MDQLEGLTRMRHARVWHPRSRRDALHASIGALVRIQSGTDGLSAIEKRKLGRAVSKMARQAVSVTTEVYGGPGRGIWTSQAGRDQHVAKRKENYRSLMPFANRRSRRVIQHIVQPAG